MFLINGLYWEVVWVDINSPMLVRSDGYWTPGCCDRSSQTIYLWNGLDTDKACKVLCHEVTHAAMFSYGIDLNICQEEIFANLMATYGKEIINITEYCGCD